MRLVNYTTNIYCLEFFNETYRYVHRDSAVIALCSGYICIEANYSIYLVSSIDEIILSSLM